MNKFNIYTFSVAQQPNSDFMFEWPRIFDK